MPVKHTILRIMESLTWWTSAWWNYRWTSARVAMWEWWRIWCNPTAWHQDITTLSQHFVALGMLLWKRKTDTCTQRRGTVKILNRRFWLINIASDTWANNLMAFTFLLSRGFILLPSFLTIFSTHTDSNRKVNEDFDYESISCNEKNSGQVQ